MMQQPAAEALSAFATFLGTPLPDDPIIALRILRKEATAEVERLLAFLDATDGDPDLEGELAGFEAPQDGREDDRADNEPSLGSINPRLGRTMIDGSPVWPTQSSEHNAGIDQTAWASGGDADTESEHDGCEPDADGEPSIGASSCVGNFAGIDAVCWRQDGVPHWETRPRWWDQTAWADSGNAGDDREGDTADDEDTHDLEGIYC